MIEYYLIGASMWFAICLVVGLGWGSMVSSRNWDHRSLDNGMLQLTVSTTVGFVGMVIIVNIGLILG